MVGRGQPVWTKRSRSVDAPAISVLLPAEQCRQQLRRVQRVGRLLPIRAVGEWCTWFNRADLDHYDGLTGDDEEVLAWLHGGSSAGPLRTTPPRSAPSPRGDVAPTGRAAVSGSVSLMSHRWASVAHVSQRSRCCVA